MSSLSKSRTERALLAPVPVSTGIPSPTAARHRVPLPRRDGEWWLVASQVSGKECLIPSSCVAKVRHRWVSAQGDVGGRAGGGGAQPGHPKLGDCPKDKPQPPHLRLQAHCWHWS